jgi:hypothetical protein
LPRRVIEEASEVASNYKLGPTWVEEREEKWSLVHMEWSWVQIHCYLHLCVCTLGLEKWNYVLGFCLLLQADPSSPTLPTWVSERLKTNSWLHPQNSNTTHTHTHSLSLSLSLSAWQKPNSLFLWNAPNYSLTCNLVWKVKQFGVCPKELDVMTLLYCRCAQTTHTGLCFAFLLFLFFWLAKIVLCIG